MHELIKDGIGFIVFQREAFFTLCNYLFVGKLAELLVKDQDFVRAIFIFDLQVQVHPKQIGIAGTIFLADDLGSRYQRSLGKRNGVNWQTENDGGK